MFQLQQFERYFPVSKEVVQFLSVFQSFSNLAQEKLIGIAQVQLKPIDDKLPGIYVSFAPVKQKARILRLLDK